MKDTARLLDDPTPETARLVIAGVEDGIVPPLTDDERDRLAKTLAGAARAWIRHFPDRISATIDRADGTTVTVQFGVEYLGPKDLEP